MNDSNAYEFIRLGIDYKKSLSNIEFNNMCYKITLTAIESKMKFDKEDFIRLNKIGRYSWFGCNSNGKGFGQGFYIAAKKYNNPSALQAYECFAEIKPFIHENKNKRAVFFDEFRDRDYFYTVTGFNEKHEITLVAYKNRDQTGKRKLFKFSNKEWLIFRKNLEL